MLMVHDLAVSAATSRERRNHISSDMFGRCLPLRGFITSQSALEEAPGCTRYTNTPPSLHRHIKQYADSDVWFGSARSEGDGGPFSSSRRAAASSGEVEEEGNWVDCG